MRDYDEIRRNFYHTYTEDAVRKQLKAFIDTEVDSTTFDSKGKRTDKVINNFFERCIYKARTYRCPNTPDEVLKDDGMLDDMFEYIDSKPKFYAGDDLDNLRSMFRNGHTHARKVANFSPNTARKIYEHYCPKEGARILDYSAGFGSRMLGCLGSKYGFSYYGIDPNTELCQQLNKFGEFINTVKQCEYQIYCQGSEQYIPELEGTIDMAFSSPPYFNLEVYCKEDTQSISKYSQYEDWLQYYVLPTIQNIYRYLKPDGLFVVNIKNLKSHSKKPLLDDWKKIAESNGFELVEIQNMKHQGAKKALAEYMLTQTPNWDYKASEEPLLVFKKKLV